MMDDTGMNLGKRRDNNVINDNNTKRDNIGIVVKIIVSIAILFLLLQCYSFYAENRMLRHNYPEQLAVAHEFYWEGLQDGYFRTFRTLANVMANYRNVPAEERRYYFDNMLFVLYHQNLIWLQLILFESPMPLTEWIHFMDAMPRHLPKETAW